MKAPKKAPKPDSTKSMDGFYEAPVGGEFIYADADFQYMDADSEIMLNADGFDDLGADGFNDLGADGFNDADGNISNDEDFFNFAPRIKFQGFPPIKGYNGGGVGGQHGGFGIGIGISDARLKENISPMADGALDKVMQMKPFDYNYKSSEYPYLDSNNHTGFMAQDLENIAPHLVEKLNINKKEVYAVKYPELITFLVKAIQEQQVEIEKLKKLIKN